MVGKTLGHYAILEPLGKGGMGEVYRARDGKLERDVAIKVLPEDFAADPERLARFEREAKLLASLNHPNIAAIYGMEDEGGTRFIVMEVVEGESLAARIGRVGPLDVDDTIEIAVQIAEALEAAHDSGVIHRDLKPANVVVTPDGKAKVLDFGLAKAYETNDAASGSAPDLSHSPTMMAATGTGVIMGTAEYMSPEQAKGKPVDKRADIWSFGCVVYEMLTARSTFGGENISETLAAILKDEPDWTGLPSDASAAVHRVLRRSLIKNPRERLRDIGDARLELLSADTDRSAPSEREARPARSLRSSRLAIPVAAAALVAGVVLGMAASRFVNLAEPPGVVRSSIDLEPGQILVAARYEVLQRPTRTAFAVSPDGERIVYAAVAGEEPKRLFLRELDRPAAELIPDTEGASSPFFSADGQSVGFFTDEGIRAFSLLDRSVRTITTEPKPPFGATWGDDDTIVFADGAGGGLLRVPASGGSAEPLTAIDSSQGETSHRLPHFLPGGEYVLYTAMRGARRWNDADIVAVSLTTGIKTTLIRGAADPRYAATGHLLFARDGSLVGQRFDPDGLQLTGQEVRIIDDIMQATNVLASRLETGAAQLSVSASGLLAYVPGGMFPKIDVPLAWVGPEGEEEITSAMSSLGHPRLSPDDGHIAYSRGGPLGGFEVWIYDVERSTPQLLTIGSSPVWSPDGDRVVFASNRHGGFDNLYWMAADGGEEPVQLAPTESFQMPSSWVEGKLAFASTTPDKEDGMDIWILPIVDGQPGELESFLATEGFESHPAFSPDGRLLAYATGPAAEAQSVWVIQHPGPGAPRKVSPAAGYSPTWSRDGRRLFYRLGQDGQDWMAVDVSPDGVPGTPVRLFTQKMAATSPTRSYDVGPDGRFLAAMTIDGVAAQPVRKINIVQNWFQELERLLPAGQ